MQRYEHGGDIYANPHVTLDFSVNTNPMGMPAAVGQELLSRVAEYARYPDPACRELRAAISLHENVPQDWILCGNGAADLIYRLCYAVKPRKALVLAPTFSEYERALEQVDCQVMYHMLKADNQFALTSEIEKQLIPGIDMLFLCHPNNPTGRLIQADVMGHILHRASENGTIVIVDECFLDFTDGLSAKQYLNNMPTIVVLKAFTKMYSLAGLRLGYLLTADRTLLDKTSNAAQCWSVSVPAQIAGRAALTSANWPQKTRRLIAEEHHFLSEGLCELGITVFPGDANFLLLRCKIPLYELLLQKGILIRACENFRGLDGSYFRVSVRQRSENNRLLQAIKEIIRG